MQTYRALCRQAGGRQTLGGNHWTVRWRGKDSGGPTEECPYLIGPGIRLHRLQFLHPFERLFSIPTVAAFIGHVVRLLVVASVCAPLFDPDGVGYFLSFKLRIGEKSTSRKNSALPEITY